MAKKNETVDLKTGEITTPKFNEMIHVEYRRPDGSLRVAQDYSNCVSLTEQHTAHLTNINYLMDTYAPDELAAYLQARNQYRREIVGHDFSKEPDLQGAKNIVLQSREEFEKLDDKIKYQFKNHVEFLKFIDNPDNVEKMIKMGILTERQIQKIQIPDQNQTPPESNQKPEEPNQKPK